MVYNGEVYNYRELKNDLNQNSFQSDSDTEVVIHNILKKGKDAINDFNGMFAIGYIDKVNHKLQLVRDRLGVKPLYYYKTESSFYFSSEPKGIICQKNFKKSINHSEVHNYFHRGNTSSEDTLFEGMKKLPPGSYLELDLITKKYIITNYWNYNDFINKPNNLSEKPFMRAFEDILDDSIGLRLRSDVPLGVYLSGGYDSSLVAYKSNLLSSKKINSFCIGFEESKFDESIHAKKIANKIGTNHHEFILKKNDIDSSLFKIIDEIIDDPIADPSIIPNLILNKLAKQDITVALSGDGGDELFGGYSSYNKSLRFNDFVNNFSSISKSMNIFSSFFIQSKLITKNRKLTRLLSLATKDNSIDFHREFTSLFPLADLNRLLPNSLEYRNNKKFKKGNYSLKELLNNDIYDSLANKLLLKTDRTSMQFGVEVREPLLDYRLFEHAAQSNSEFFIKNSSNKYPIKNLAFKYISRELLDRPKSGFNIPIQEFSKSFFKENIHLVQDNSFTREQGIFSSDFLNYISNNIDSNKLNFRQVFSLFIFQKWYTRWYI
jgi:asparagine synthase (glutamine-hydrolysing)